MFDYVIAKLHQRLDVYPHNSAGGTSANCADQYSVGVNWNGATALLLGDVTGDGRPEITIRDCANSPCDKLRRIALPCPRPGRLAVGLPSGYQCRIVGGVAAVVSCDHSTMTVRVGAVQMEAIPGDVSGNMEVAAGWAGKAVRAGADLVVLPEAVSTGYDTTVFREVLPTLDDTGWLAPVQDVVDASGVVMVVNSALDWGDRRTLTSLVLTAGQKPWAAYDKQHLFHIETPVFAAGESGASFRLEGMDFALSVCYDANFPEHAAAAAAGGAIVYVNSGAYFPGGGHRRDLYKAARALDNGMYVVFSGLVGAPSDFIGGSAVYDPIGRPIVRLGTEEGVAMAEIDPALVARTREEQRMWRDRRQSLGPRVRRTL